MPLVGAIGSGWRGRPLCAEIDLDALAHNVRALKRRAGELVRAEPLGLQVAVGASAGAG